jgi:hypothetical protein
MMADKAPYLVTVIVAALAWTFTHVVDRLLASPLVTYQEQLDESGGKKKLSLTLKNISSEKTFRDIHLLMAVPFGGLITNASVTPVQPAWEGDKPPTWHEHTFEHIFPVMQPGTQLEVSVTYDGNEPPSLRMFSDGTIKFVQPSWETWLVEHEVGVLIGLLLVGIVLLIIAILVPSSTRREARDEV